MGMAELLRICFISGCPVIIELNQADAGFGGGFFVERSNVAVQHGTGNIEPACKLLHSLIRGEKNLQNLPFPVGKRETVTELLEMRGGAVIITGEIIAFCFRECERIVAVRQHRRNRIRRNAGRAGSGYGPAVYIRRA